MGSAVYDAPRRLMSARKKEDALAAPEPGGGCGSRCGRTASALSSLFVPGGSSPTPATWFHHHQHGGDPYTYFTSLSRLWRLMQTLGW
jgi:hypothetical protein